jgi:hypothetical protein
MLFDTKKALSPYKYLTANPRYDKKEVGIPF